MLETAPLWTYFPRGDNTTPWKYKENNSTCHPLSLLHLFCSFRCLYNCLGMKSFFICFLAAKAFIISSGYTLCQFKKQPTSKSFPSLSNTHWENLSNKLYIRYIFNIRIETVLDLRSIQQCVAAYMVSRRTRFRVSAILQEISPGRKRKYRDECR